MSVDKEKDRQRAQTALAGILGMEKRLSEDFDPKRELQEAREERYGKDFNSSFYYDAPQNILNAYLYGYIE